jgi:phosphate transport system protein
VIVLLPTVWAIGLSQRVDQLQGLTSALAVLATGNVNAIQGIVAGDQQINQLSAEIDWALLRTMARQASVASDLRLVAGLLHVNEHLERMGDLCVNLARATPELVERPPPADIQATLTQLGTAVRQVVNAALVCFTDSDSAAAARLPALDTAVDQLNDHIFRQLNQITDPSAVAWATRLVLVAVSWSGSATMPSTSANRSASSSPARSASSSHPKQPGHQPAPGNRQLTGPAPVWTTHYVAKHSRTPPGDLPYKTARPADRNSGAKNGGQPSSLVGSGR